MSWLMGSNTENVKGLDRVQGPKGTARSAGARGEKIQPFTCRVWKVSQRESARKDFGVI